MKLDKIRFAELVAMLCRHHDIATSTIIKMDELIEIEAQSITAVINYEPNLNEMLRAIGNGKKIEAIKCYRAMTGLSLKEAKDAVELAMVPTV